jgi:TrmH family RNA methyltransferase
MRYKKYDRDADHAYTFGVFPTVELLTYQTTHVREVLIASKGEKNEGVNKIIAQCEALRLPIEVNDKLIDRIAPKENTYAIGVFEKYRSVLNPHADQVVFAQPSDMGNLGTNLRTLLGFGITQVALIRPAVDLFDPRVIRASMGALFRITCDYFESFDLYHAANPLTLYPLMTDGAIALHDARFESPFALIFGNESSGLPPSFRDLGQSITIPHLPTIDSLNLSMAVGIAVYEATKSHLSPR